MKKIEKWYFVFLQKSKQDSLSASAFSLLLYIALVEENEEWEEPL